MNWQEVGRRWPVRDDKGLRDDNGLDEGLNNGLQEALDKDSAAEINAMQLPDMQVYSLNEAACIGRVRDVIIDGRDKCLLALAVDKGGWYHDVRVVPAGKIHTLGDNLVAVDEQMPPKRPVNLPRIVELMHQPCHPVGLRIVSDEGELLGRVESFYLNRYSGEITRLEMAGGLFGRLWVGRASVAAEHILRIEAEEVVVSSAVQSDLRLNSGLLKVNFAAVADLAGQQAESLNRLRENAAKRLQELNQKRRQQREQTEQTENKTAENLPSPIIEAEVPVNL